MSTIIKCPLGSTNYCEIYCYSHNSIRDDYSTTATLKLSNKVGMSCFGQQMTRVTAKLVCAARALASADTYTRRCVFCCLGGSFLHEVTFGHASNLDSNVPWTAPTTRRPSPSPSFTPKVCQPSRAARESVSTSLDER